MKQEILYRHFKNEFTAIENCFSHDKTISSTLLEILCCQTKMGKSGFPIIESSAYQKFLNHVPHLFERGNVLLANFKVMGERVENLSEISFEEASSFKRALEVLQRVILTASVTSPPDLWVFRQLISTLLTSQLDQYVAKGGWIDLEEISKEEGYELKQLQYVFGFLYSRGHFDYRSEKGRALYVVRDLSFYNQCRPLETEITRNAIPMLSNFLKNGDQAAVVDQFLSMELSNVPPLSWVPSWDEIEIGYRMTPLVLAIRNLDRNRDFTFGTNILSQDLKFSNTMLFLLKKSGAIDEDHLVTHLGERMFLRGPGPYGIIHAYYPYMEKHLELLKSEKGSIWVARGENVSASQDANTRSFQQINNSIDKFCEDYSFEFSVFIEHAVGHGEATRQRFEISGDAKIQYFGADLEQSAIDKAIEGKEAGKLPGNMIFISGADIGAPEILIEGVVKEGFSTDKSVMVVGNGFHEVRNQTNEKMIEVFKKYADSGIIIAFTEESGLRDQDLLKTGWNTYHAGFKFMHNISGQGLRPAVDIHEIDDHQNDNQERYSWKKCAELGGYQVLKKYTNRSRSIFPHRPKDGHNPSISVSYFCVPLKVFKQLKKS